MSNYKHNKHIGRISERDIFMWVNISLIGVSLLLVFYYVMLANTVTSSDYRVQTLREELGMLSELNASLMSDKLALENPTALLAFARANNLVEAKNIVYIFENRNVALQR